MTAQVNNFLPQRNQPFQDTKTRIKNYISTSLKIYFHNKKQYPHSLSAEVFKLKWTILAGMNLTFYQLYIKKDSRKCTASSVPLITKLIGLPSTEDPSWACPSAMSDGYGPIEANLPTGKEDGSHVVIPCLYHLVNLPKLISIGWGVCVSELKFTSDGV